MEEVLIDLRSRVEFIREQVLEIMNCRRFTNECSECAGHLAIVYIQLCQVYKEIT